MRSWLSDVELVSPEAGGICPRKFLTVDRLARRMAAAAASDEHRGDLAAGHLAVPRWTPPRSSWRLLSF
eukprot:5345893-Pyramimonas_sp.AAC.1